MHGLLLLIVTSLIPFPGDRVYAGGDPSPQAVPGTQVWYLEDPESAYSAEEVLRSGGFRPGKTQILNFGISPSTWWFRMDITNTTGKSPLYLSVEQPLLDLVQVYLVSSQGTEASLLEEISRNLPYYSREVPQLDPVFRIPVDASETVTILLKVKSSTPIVLPLKAGTGEAVTHANFKKEQWLSIYIGIMLTTFIYNLFIFFSIGDRIYLYYVVCVLLVALTQTALTGFTFKYFWPENTFIAHHGPLLFSCLAGIAALEFIREFLHVKEFTPRLALGIPIFNAVFILAMILGLSGARMEGFFLMQCATVFAALYSLFVSYRIYRYNYRAARFFLLAWAILLIGAVVFVLKDFNLVPYNNLSTSALLISSALEALLLSFALADKINILRKEKQESQEQAMAAMAEIAKIGREQNIILETKVNERTLALKESNRELSKAIEELKEAESQLVASEKMASLGQLTAGIAHEINNPMNFVRSNIRPLERDIGIIIELLEKVEGVARSAASDEEKKALIQQIKAQADYDYLKSEINDLMQGILEGSTRTAEIVRELRNFSRIDEAELQKSSINNGIESTLVIVNHMFHRRIAIDKSYGDLPLIDCYPGKLNQVFLNIITNGVQAIHAKFGNQPGGVLTIRTAANGNTVSTLFKDNGVGMDKTTREKIFEPFFTTKRASQGTGLGMSIVYGIISKHQGKITVKSIPGEGTEFLIHLPVTQKNGQT